MNSIPLISTDQELYNTVNRLIKEENSLAKEIIQLRSLNKALMLLTTLNYKLMFVDFSDNNVDPYALLEIVISDPVLMHMGIVGICLNYKQAKQLEKIRSGNIVVVLIKEDMNVHLPRIIKILKSNEELIVQKEVGSNLVHNISNDFELNNDPMEAVCFANIICNYLYNTNRVDITKKGLLNIALYEMLINAIEHGNCGISFEEKSDWLENDKYIGDLIAIKCKDPQIAEKRVKFQYTITPTKSYFYIEDMGNGFDWRKHQKSLEEEVDVFALHGRGIMMAKNLTSNLKYNEKGNAVSFELVHHIEEDTIIPDLYDEIEKSGTEKSSSQFFLKNLAINLYQVLNDSNNRELFTKDRKFNSELAFLLNNLQENTIVAIDDYENAMLSKDDFIKEILDKPSYALYLSRLLSKKIGKNLHEIQPVSVKQ